MARVVSSGNVQKGGARSLHVVGFLHLFTAGIIALLRQIIAITITNIRFLIIVVLSMLPCAFGMELGHADDTSRKNCSDLRVVLATTAATAAVAVAAAASGENVVQEGAKANRNREAKRSRGSREGNGR